MFYKGESYQGAQLRIYPYPLLDGITGQREQGTFTALYLENEYVRLAVLPELGGRLFSATDKTNGYEFFYRATWDYAFHSAAYYQLATLSCRKGQFATALEQIGHCLSTNARNTKATNVRAAILRRLGRSEQAQRLAKKVLATDPLNFLAMNERQLACDVLGQTSDATAALREKSELMRDDVQPYLELATDYMECGLWTEAISSYERAIGCNAGDPRYYIELDDLYERANTDPEKRLDLLEANAETIMRRKDLLIRRITLLVRRGDCDKAIELLTSNQFFIAEGGGRELGNKGRAEELTKDLVKAATRRLDDDWQVDFFAKFGEQATRQARRADSHCELGLGLLLEGRHGEARNQFEQALNFNAAHTWAEHHLSQLVRK